MSKFGFHIGKGVAFEKSQAKTGAYSQSVPAAVKYVAEQGFDMKATQVFVAGPQSYNMVMDPLDAQLLGKYSDESGVDIIVHGSYYDLPWSNKPVTAHAGIKLIKREIATCKLCHAKGLNIHFPSATNSAIVQGLKLFADDLKENGVPVCKIYMEVEARKPSPLTFEAPIRLASLVRDIRMCKELDGVVGLTLDTAHIWSSEMDISSASKAKDYVDSLRRNIGEFPYIIHLNDNANPFGVHRDVHAPLETGCIWANHKKDPGWLEFVKFADEMKGHVILERSISAESPSDYGVLRREKRWLLPSSDDAKTD